MSFFDTVCAVVTGIFVANLVSSFIFALFQEPNPPKDTH